jgi:hypothetical protein
LQVWRCQAGRTLDELPLDAGLRHASKRPRARNNRANWSSLNARAHMTLLQLHGELAPTTGRPMLFGASSGIRRPVHRRPLNGEAARLQEEAALQEQRFLARKGMPLVLRSIVSASDGRGSEGRIELRIARQPGKQHRQPLSCRGSKNTVGIFRSTLQKYLDFLAILRIVPGAGGTRSIECAEAPKKFCGFYRMPFNSRIFSAPESARKRAIGTLSRKHLWPIPK